MRHVQNPKAFEPLEGAFGDVADGVVAQAQDAQAAQVGQALLIQPGKVVEGQNPEEEKADVTTGSRGSLLTPVSRSHPGRTRTGPQELQGR